MSVKYFSPCHSGAGLRNPGYTTLSSRAYAWRSSHLALLFTGLPRSFHPHVMTRGGKWPVNE